MPTVCSGNISIVGQRVVNDNFSAFSQFSRKWLHVRFRIRELIVRYNEGRPREERIKMETVADAIGVPRSTLAVMSTFNRKPVTNTANLEAVCRFFCQRIPDFRMEDLVEFFPHGRRDDYQRGELYPASRKKSTASKDGTAVAWTTQSRLVVR